MCVPLLSFVFLCSPGIVGAMPGTPACNWFGLTLGYKNAEWGDILRQDQVEQAIRKHCHTLYCGREPRMHHSMVYEIMPCDHRCVTINRRYYRLSCFQE